MLASGKTRTPALRIRNSTDAAADALEVVEGPVSCGSGADRRPAMKATAASKSAKSSPRGYIFACLALVFM